MYAASSRKSTKVKWLNRQTCLIAVKLFDLIFTRLHESLGTNYTSEAAVINMLHTSYKRHLVSH